MCYPSWYHGAISRCMGVAATYFFYLWERLRDEARTDNKTTIAISPLLPSSPPCNVRCLVKIQSMSPNPHLRWQNAFSCALGGARGPAPALNRFGALNPFPMLSVHFFRAVLQCFVERGWYRGYVV